MLRYILKRLIYSVVILWAVATAVFFGLRLLPGDPARIALGLKATDASVAALRARLGLNQPMYLQYIDWFRSIFTLNLGSSISSGQDVITLISRAAPKTFSIGLLGLVIGICISIPAGIISAVHRNELPDYVATITAFVGITMPAFFIGILLVLIFGVWLKWVPVYGYVSPTTDFIQWFMHSILPAIAVGLPYAGIVTRMTRSSLLEVLNSAYMETARAKGIPPRIALAKHALRNAMIPVVTISGLQIAIILVGSVTVELVFGISGLGRLLVQSLLKHDYQVVQFSILLIASIMILMNLLVDIAYVYVDPRIRLEGKQA